jgi:hypothetical protein
MMPMEAPRLTLHAQVRYLERYIDPKAVKRALSDTQSASRALDILREQYGHELAALSDLIVAASESLNRVPDSFRLQRYRLRVSGVRLAMVGQTCVTTLPRWTHRKIQERRVQLDANEFECVGSEVEQL